MPIRTQRLRAVIEWFRADDTGKLRPGHSPLIRNRGHASFVTTERYIHHTLAELAKAAAVLEDGGVFDPITAPTVGKGISPASQRSETSKPDVH